MPKTAGVAGARRSPRAGVQAWLTRETDVRIAYTDDWFDTAPGRVTVLVLDLNLHGRIVILDIAAASDAGQRIMVFSQFTDRDLIPAALDAGASTVAAKNDGGDHLIRTVAHAAADRPYVNPTTAGVMTADHRVQTPALSARERIALLWWFQSMSKASVARRMGVSPHTVDMFIRRARAKYAKAGRPAPTKADMVVRAIEDGLIAAEEIAGYRPSAAG